MRQKHIRFQENKGLDNCIEPSKPCYTTIKGQWHNIFFKNNNPITLEIGCGHGAYVIGLAKLFPQRNFIGIDIKGDRLWKGAKEAKKQYLSNVAFLRIFIESLDDFFSENEVDEIWITFPDPRPKNRDIKRRLTSPRFLDLYRHILADQGKIHLKTDNTLLYDYTLKILHKQNLKILKQTLDLYNSPYLVEHWGIQTTYEKRFLAQGMKIHYLCFQYI